MKRQLLTYLWLVSLIFLMACQKENMGDCFKSTGKEKTERRSISSFETLEMEDEIEVNFIESPNYFVEVIGGENLLELIETKSENGRLSIKNNNRCNWVRSFKRKVSVDVYAPSFRALNVRGSGDFNSLDTLVNDTFLLNIYGGSGNVKLKANCDYIELKSHTGPTDITATGSCRELVAYLKGIGNLNAIGMTAQDGLVINENTGELKVKVEQQMKVELRNFGNILYQGDPAIDLSDTGEGRLIKID